VSYTRRDFLKVLGSASVVLSFPSLPGCGVQAGRAADPFGGIYPQFSGVYPHLAFYNHENECGTGAVVPWAGRLWAITYGPHLPLGSSDKLYEIDEQLNITIRPESVGGTHANRMIHRESQQLFIGLHAIDAEGNVRTIVPAAMPGRHTGTARHLVDGAGKVYYASMEEGFYEVDVRSLDVNMLHRDGNSVTPRDYHGFLPGYHGKGLYTGQGRLVYANNGEPGPEALRRPDIPSGSLAEWDGVGWNWTVVRRNQFTEVTGPGGISGNENLDDPIWSYGWDHRSAIFMLRDGGRWHTFRMPKASHTYDGAHGWHTEWPRIREIGNDRMLMTMHGMFWDFPRHFSARNTGGIRPLSTYLKIIGDFCEWQGKVVMGADDAAKSEFAANPLPSKGTMVEQSNSNLWFVDADQLDQFGAPLGRGGPWVNDPVEAGANSDPYYFAGFDHRMVHLRHDAGRPLTFTFEIDRDGRGDWRPLTTLTVPPSGYAHHIFEPGIQAEWIRARADASASEVTLVYQMAGRNDRPARTARLFDGLAGPGAAFTAGVLRSPGEDRGTLEFAAQEVTADGQVSELGYYEIGPDMRLRRVDAPGAYREMIDELSPHELPYVVDAASVLVTDLEGQRWRLPRGSTEMKRVTASAPPRTLREVATERSLLNVQGHIYELPRANSGGFPKIRPVATSDLLIMELASWRGLLVLAGVTTAAAANPHIVRSDDGRCALWFGVVDDLWQLGKPRGEGGPWMETAVRAGQPSDPYLMSGYDQKELRLSHAGTAPVRFRVEVDLTGDGIWAQYQELEVAPGRGVTHRFPDGFNAYWVRLVPAADVQATAQLRYS
jgi:hypothetical protein